MIGILLRTFIGGVAMGAFAIAVITKSNIAEKIKEIFFQKRISVGNEKTSNKDEDPFGSIIREKQKDSVSVDVFFGNGGTERITVTGGRVADDINEGDWIILKD